MSTRYFTIDEAAAMIPRLRSAFNRLLQLRTQMRLVFTRLEAAGFAPEDDDFPLVVEGAGPAVVSDRATLKALMATFRDAIGGVEAMGCHVKGIEPGLVDWPCRVDGRDVLLCWQHGETELGWWHESDAGFAGRRPLGELTASRDEDTP